MADGERDGDDGGTQPWPVLRNFLRRLFIRLGAGSHDAEDLAQEGLARLMRRPGSQSTTPSLGFVATVGRNLWRDRLRARGRRPAHQILEPDEDVADVGAWPPEVAARNEDQCRLEAALAALDPRHRTAIVLVILERRSYSDAARVLGVPRGTVKSRVHYGIERLRMRLDASPPAC